MSVKETRKQEQHLLYIYIIRHQYTLLSLELFRSGSIYFRDIFVDSPFPGIFILHENKF